MPKFEYLVKDGEGKDIKGTQDAADVGTLVSVLRSKGYTIVRVKEVKGRGAFGGPKLKGKKRRITADDMVVFSRQVATMVSAGVTLIQALDVLGEQMDNAKFRSIIYDMKRDVESGMRARPAHAEDVSLPQSHLVEEMDHECAEVRVHGGEVRGELPPRRRDEAELMSDETRPARIVHEIDGDPELDPTLLDGPHALLGQPRCVELFLVQWGLSRRLGALEQGHEHEGDDRQEDENEGGDAGRFPSHGKSAPPFTITTTSRVRLAATSMVQRVVSNPCLSIQ